MAKSFINTGDAVGNIVVEITGDVVLDGKIYHNADPHDTWTHEQLENGADFDVQEPHTYHLLVNALFKDTGTANVCCTIGGRSKTIPLAGDADDDGIDLEIAQFYVFT